MRFERISVLLVLLPLAACGPPESEVRPSSSAAASPAGTVWIYDEQAALHGALPLNVRTMRAKNPRDVGEAVCEGLGGGLDFMQSPAGRERVAIQCAFVENGHRISAPFGELRRIRTNQLGD